MTGGVSAGNWQVITVPSSCQLTVHGCVSNETKWTVVSLLEERRTRRTIAFIAIKLGVHPPHQFHVVRQHFANSVGKGLEKLCSVI